MAAATGSPRDVGFPHIRESLTPAGCPTIDLNADTIYLKAASEPTGAGLRPTVGPYPDVRRQTQVH